MSRQLYIQHNFPSVAVPVQLILHTERTLARAVNFDGVNWRNRLKI